MADDDQSITDLTARPLKYLAAGAVLVWVLDPVRSQVIEFTPPNQVRLAVTHDVLEGGSLLPGLTRQVSELFE